MPFYCIGSDTFLPRNCRSLTATPLQKTKSKNCHRSSSVKGIMSKILLTALIESQVPLSQLKAGPYICIFFLSDIYFCKCLAGLWHTWLILVLHEQCQIFVVSLKTFRNAPVVWRKFGFSYLSFFFCQKVHRHPATTGHIHRGSL